MATCEHKELACSYVCPTCGKIIPPKPKAKPKAKTPAKTEKTEE